MNLVSDAAAIRDVRPKWAIADREVDITDIWAEATDPENERDETCTAYLHEDISDRMTWGCDIQITFTLRGISIEDRGLTIFRDREWALKILGPAAIWKIEDAEMEAV